MTLTDDIKRVILIQFFVSILFCTDIFAQSDSCDVIKRDFVKVQSILDQMQKQNNVSGRDSIYKIYIKRVNAACPCDYWFANHLYFSYYQFTFYKLKSKEGALAMFHHKIQECQEVNDSTTLFMHYRKGMFHLRNDDYKNMKHHLDEAVHIGERKFESNYRDLYASRVNIGLYYNWKQEYETALSKHMENEQLLGNRLFKDTSARINNVSSIIDMARVQGLSDIEQEYTNHLTNLTKGTKFEKEALDNLHLGAFDFYVKNNQLEKASLYLQTIEEVFFDYYTDIGLSYVSYLRKTGKRTEAMQQVRVLDSLFVNIPKHHFLRVNLNLEKHALEMNPSGNGEEWYKSITTSLHNNYINLINENVSEHSDNISLITSKYFNLINQMAGYADIQKLLEVYDKMNNLKNASGNYYKKLSHFVANSQDEELRNDIQEYRRLTSTLLKSNDDGPFLGAIEKVSKKIQLKLDDANIRWHTSTQIKDLKGQLSEDEVFIDFFQPDKLSENDVMCAFIIGKSGGYFYKYQNVSSGLNNQTEGSNYTNNGKENKRLYDYLIQPLEASLVGKKHLYVSTDGVLNQIALDILSPSGKKNDMLGDRFEVTYVESATSLIDLKSIETKTLTPDKYLLVGGIKYDCMQDAQENALLAQNEPILRSEILYLPGSKVEVDMIGNKFKNNTISFEKLEDCKPTKTTVMLALEDGSYNHVHISTHGTFIQQKATSKNKYFSFNKNSQLVLSKSSSTEDQSLSAVEILNLNLENKELVFLSACNTGKGSFLAGMGNASVANAFKKAGVNKVIATLWPIPDDITVELCDYFYAHYLESRDVNESLRYAKKILRSKYSPEKWAAFRVMN